MASNHKRAEARFVICINNRAYPASLERGKVYRVIADADASKRGYLRVIDESGEDYLYPENRFAAIRLPQSVRRALLRAS
ncbi:MAG: hypothetical protein ACRD2M_10465 [Terriglobales bacterium]